MEIEILLKNIKYSTKGSLLKDISDKTIEDDLILYYNNKLKLKDLSKKYGMSINKLRDELPKYSSNLNCRICDSVFLFPLPLASELKKNHQNIQFKECNNCSHIQCSLSCYCETCSLEKNKYLKENIFDKENNFESLNIDERIQLSIVLNKNFVNFGDIETRIEGLSDLQIIELLDKGIFLISEDNPLTKFRWDTKGSVKPIYSELNYSLKNLYQYCIDLEQKNDISVQKNFNLLKYPNLTLFDSYDEVLNQYDLVIKKEIYRLFKIQCKNRNFNNDYTLKEIYGFHQFILSYIMNYSPSQIYQCIWVGIAREATKRGSKIGKYKYYSWKSPSMSDLLESIKNTVIYYEKNNQMDGYSFPNSLSYLDYSTIYFHKILDEYNWFEINKKQFIENLQKSFKKKATTNFINRYN